MTIWDRIRDDAELKRARNVLSFREFYKIIRHARAEYRAAIDGLLENPHGCAFCDYGKLRNPDKSHADNCAHALVERLIKRADGEPAPGPPDGPGIPTQPFGWSHEPL